MSNLPPDFLEHLQAIKGKRARIVVEHILKHGYITTETLEKTYGYKHPPRAVQDVRDQGVPLESFTVKSEDGRSIAAYRFSQEIGAEVERIGGRKAFPRSLKPRLIAESGGRCALCSQQYDPRFLQIDHRVPYQVAGETLEDNFMLVCRSCNRSKSWTCEHCQNWLTQHDVTVCLNCYWCSPTHYEHIALLITKRLELIWQQDEQYVYTSLEVLASARQQTLVELAKSILASYVHKPHE